MTGSESSLRFIHRWGRESGAPIFSKNRTVFTKIRSNFIVFRDFETVPLQQASWKNNMLELLIRRIFHAHFQPCLPRFFSFQDFDPSFGVQGMTDFHQTYTVDILTWYLSSTRGTTFLSHFLWRSNVLFLSHKKGSLCPQWVVGSNRGGSFFH